MPARDTLILTRRDVKRVLTMELALEAVELAFAHHGRDEVRMPPKVYLDLPEFHGDFRAMPAYLPAAHAASTQPDNKPPPPTGAITASRSGT